MTSTLYSRMISSQDPSAIALYYDDQLKFTYRQLLVSAYRSFTLLNARKRPQSPFLLTADKSLQMYGTVLTSILLGIPFVPIHSSWPAAKIIHLIKSTDSGFWLGGSEHSVHNEVSKLTPIELFAFADLEKISPNPWVAPLSKKAYYMTSSGSTGEPKLVLINQNQFFSLIDIVLKTYPINRGTRVSNTYDLTFDPSLVDIFLTFCQGGCLVPLLPKDQYNIFTFIKDRQIQVWSSTPSLVNLNQPLLKGRSSLAKLENVKWSLFTGEALSSNTLRFWQHLCPNSEIDNLYGPIETTVWVTRASLTNLHTITDSTSIPIGTPLSSFDSVVVDEHLNKVTPGSIGELCVSGPQVFSGYQNKPTPQLIKIPWDKDGKTWFRTGDLVFEKNNQLYFQGRIDFQFKVAGQRISPEEIEKQIFSHFNIECLLVPIYSLEVEADIQKIHVVHFQVLKAIELQSLLDWLKSELPPSLVPKKFVYCPNPPRTSSGKIDRAQLFRQEREAS